MSSYKLIKSIRFYFRDIDSVLFFAVLALVSIGIVNIYGITGFGDLLFKKQVIIGLLGFFIMVVCSFFNYRYFKNYSLLVLVPYISSLFLLALTFYSRSIRGTNSWIIFGNFTFEPAEITKLFLIILMAKYFSQRHIHIYQFKHIVASGLYFIIPALLIINQPDLGSTIVLGLIWASLLLAAGINKKHILTLLLIVSVIAVGSWSFVLEPY